VALITGAAHGLGAGTAEALAARGWSVALVDLDLAAGEAVATRIGGRAAAFAADITDSAALDAAVCGAVERFGGIDCCFANAGIASGGAMRHADPEVFAVNVEVNLIGAFRTVRACLPRLVESRGYALLNASASALMAPPGLGAYGASKAGVESLGDTLRREVAHLGVDVGVLYLLWVDTDMVTGSEEKIEAFAKLRGAMRGPMARTMPRERAIGTIVAAIEGRRRRAMAPRWLNAVYRLRGFAGRPVERDMLEMAPLVDEVTAAEASKRGVEGALRTDTPAGAAAARAVAERH
jgi:NAD(P)-dependent dehydrogenase (short-subunit alcohol dehydrogenase family)